MESIRENVPGEVDSIDSKTMRGAKDTGASKNMPHIVSAWGVENNLHWVLEVRFGEDASRKRKKVAESFNIVLEVSNGFIINR